MEGVMRSEVFRLKRQERGVNEGVEGAFIPPHPEYSH
jgi:hypothetical protein